MAITTNSSISVNALQRALVPFGNIDTSDMVTRFLHIIHPSAQIFYFFQIFGYHDGFELAGVLY